MSKGTVQVKEGQWYVWHSSEKWVCCDCSLTHIVESKRKNGKLIARMFRDNRATANRRRAAGIEISAKRKS